jgi:uncharacterized damage-inducible protein DinB
MTTAIMETKAATKMMEPFLNEFRAESATTRRVLERIPADKLGWKPHAKSMSLGGLAMHIAEGPGNIAAMLQKDEHDVTPSAFQPAAPKNLEEIKTAFEQSVVKAENFLATMSEQAAAEHFQLKVHGKTRLNQPRISLVRVIMMNHMYHHRGQMSVYLRLLDVPVPSIYGPSQDENPPAWAND